MQQGPSQELVTVSVAEFETLLRQLVCRVPLAGEEVVAAEERESADGRGHCAAAPPVLDDLPECLATAGEPVDEDRRAACSNDLGGVAPS